MVDMPTLKPMAFSWFAILGIETPSALLSNMNRTILCAEHPVPENHKNRSSPSNAVSRRIAWPVATIATTRPTKLRPGKSATLSAVLKSDEDQIKGSVLTLTLTTGRYTHRLRLKGDGNKRYCRLHPQEGDPAGLGRHAATWIISGKGAGNGLAALSPQSDLGPLCILAGALGKQVPQHDDNHS